jgi:hypothetical protein
VIVGGSKGLDVSRPGLSRIDQVSPSPREGRPPKVTSEKIADETRKAPVPVGKGMNCDKAVTEAHGDFVGRIRRVLDPVSGVVDSLLNVRGDPIGLDADIACACTILPRPAPYVAEHPLVQFAQKITIENITFARTGPL